MWRTEWRAIRRRKVFKWHLSDPCLSPFCISREFMDGEPRCTSTKVLDHTKIHHDWNGQQQQRQHGQVRMTRWRRHSTFQTRSQTKCTSAVQFRLWNVGMASQWPFWHLYYLTSSRKGHSKVRNLFRDIHCSSFSYQFKWKLEAMKGWIVWQFYQSWHDSTLEKECSRCVLSFA